MPPFTVASFATTTHVAALDDPDPGDDARGRRLSVVELPAGEGVQLEERGPGVDEAIDALAGGQLAARAVPLDRRLAAAGRDERGPFAELRDERLHRSRPPPERLVARDVRAEHRHAASSVTRTAPDATRSPTPTSMDRTPAS